MNQKILYKLKTPRIKALALHPTRNLIALALYNGTFILYDTTGLKPVLNIRVSDMPLRTACFYNEKLLLGCDDGNIYIYEWDKKVGCVNAHKDFIRRIIVKNNVIITCSDDTTIKQWEFRGDTLQLVMTYDSHVHFVMDIGFDPSNNNKFISASLDHTVKLWNIGNKSEACTMKNHTDGVNSCSFNSEYVISVSDDLTCKVWDSYKCIYTIRGHTKNINIVRCFDNVFITGSEDGFIKIYDRKSWKLLVSYNTTLERVWDIQLKDGKLFIACDEGMLVLSFGKSGVCVAMSKNKIFYNVNETLFSVKMESINLVKELTYLENTPYMMKVSDSGKLIGLLSDGEYGLYNVLGFRSKDKGKADDICFYNEELVVRCKDELKIKESTLKIKGMNKLVCVKDLEVYCLVVGEKTCIYYKKTLVAEISGVYTRGTFYGENKLVLINESKLLIVEVDIQMGRDLIEQGLDIKEITDHSSVKQEIVRAIDHYAVDENIVYYTSKGKLYYLINDQVEYGYMLLEGIFCGVKENTIYYFNKEIKSTEINKEFIMWQQEIMNGNETTLTDENMNDKGVNFLCDIGKYEIALKLCKDSNKKFELLIKLNKLDEALENCDTEYKYKKLMKQYLSIGNYNKAAECAKAGKDYSNLYILNLLADGNYEDEIMENCENKNLEFMVAYGSEDYERCKTLLSGTLYGCIMKNYY